MDEERTIERRRMPRIEVADRTATIDFRMRVRLLDLSVNGVQLGVADGDVTVGTRAWLTAVLGSAPLSVAVDVRRAIPAAIDDGEPAVGARLRCNVSDTVTVARFVSRSN